jgi:hypothetical protein
VTAVPVLLLDVLGIEIWLLMLVVKAAALQDINRKRKNAARRHMD